MFRNPQMCVTGFRAIRFRGSRSHGSLEVSGKRGVVKAVKALIERVRGSEKTKSTPGSSGLTGILKVSMKSREARV